MGRVERIVRHRNGESHCGDCAHFDPVSLRDRRERWNTSNSICTSDTTHTTSTTDKMDSRNMTAPAGTGAQSTSKTTGIRSSVGPGGPGAASRAAGGEKRARNVAAESPPVGWGVCELLVERLLSGGYPREAVLPHNADAGACPEFAALEARELRGRVRRWGRVG